MSTIRWARCSCGEHRNPLLKPWKITLTGMKSSTTPLSLFYQQPCACFINSRYQRDWLRSTLHQAMYARQLNASEAISIEVNEIEILLGNNDNALLII
jgi:hypothetical protein